MLYEVITEIVLSAPVQPGIPFGSRPVPGPFWVNILSHSVAATPFPTVSSHCGRADAASKENKVSENMVFVTNALM